MSKLELRPRSLLGILAVLGLLVNIVILATGVGAADDIEPLEPRVDRRSQQRVLEGLEAEIAALMEQQLPTTEEAQENALDLFSLANKHGVRIETWNNGIPQAETLGSTQVQKLVTSLEVRGQRSKVINMLLSLKDSMLITNVNVNGTPEDWGIQFALTQYLRAS